MERFDLVQRAYDELVASGDVKDLSPFTSNFERLIEEQKAYITRRSAFYLNEVNANIGLLSKTTGNNVMGLSVDIVIDKVSAIFYDIASDNGKRAIIINSGGSSDSTLIPRWVQPTKELAGLSNDTPDNPPDNIEVLAKLELIISQLDTIQQVLAHANINTNQILNKPSPVYRGNIFGFQIILRPE